MIQRKQTLFLLAAIVMTVICLCMQIGSFKAAGLEVARVYNLLLPVQCIARCRMVCVLLRRQSDGR